MNSTQPPAAPEDPQPRYEPPVSPQVAPPVYAPPVYAPPVYAPPQYMPPYASTYPTAYASATPGPGEPFDGAHYAADRSRPLYSANPGQAFGRFFKNYAVFSGRASRSEYWWIVLLFWGTWFLSGTAFGIVESASYRASIDNYELLRIVGMLLGMTVTIIFIGVFIPLLAITWRRLHDANLPGPLALIAFVPFFGSIALTVLLALPPKPEGRRFM